MSIAPRTRGRRGRQDAAPSSLVLYTSIVSPAGAARNKGAGACRRFDRLDEVRAMLPEWRTAACMVDMTGGLVSVLRHAQHGSASYGGLSVCGSVWVCPVCAARIGARRADEIVRGVAGWVERGGQVSMLTLTLRHNAEQQLAPLNKVLNEGYRLMRQGRIWVTFAQRYGLAGSITAREYTHGANGWHPHLHVLLFWDGGPSAGDLVQVEQFLAARWRDALARLGGDADLEHGTDLRPAEKSAGKYVSKLVAGWSAGAELAGGQAKQGRGGSRTPAQLLDSAGGTDGRPADGRATALFVEYAFATKGRNWITWSRGLRKLCGLVEEVKSDEEIAAEQEEGATPILVLTRPQWKWVLGNALRGPLLGAACAGDSHQLAAWLLEQGLEVEPWQLDYSYHVETPPEGA